MKNGSGTPRFVGRTRTQQCTRRPYSASSSGLTSSSTAFGAEAARSALSRASVCPKDSRARRKMARSEPARHSTATVKAAAPWYTVVIRNSVSFICKKYIRFYLCFVPFIFFNSSYSSRLWVFSLCLFFSLVSRSLIV